MRCRELVLKSARRTAEVEVLIVGGGINGIGVYRDLAAQGIRALLVDRADFCSGTSAAPSRLIHGGLRYLQTGEFGLVRESVEERNRLLNNAPHLVRPIPVWLPLHSWFAGLVRAPLQLLHATSRAGPNGALVTKIGLMFYDWLGRELASLPRHRLIPSAELRRTLPSVAPDTMLAAEYYDARVVHPERLALELIADAEAEDGDSIALSYVALEAHESDAVVLQDVQDGTTFTVSPRLVVNAAGAWADQVNRRLGILDRLVGGARGSHLVLRHAGFARELDGRMVYFETPDHRACLAYPLGGELVLLGTTDISSDDPDDHQCTDGEVTYLLDVLHRALPGVGARREHIVFRYAGVRPLPRADGLQGSAVSRDHALRCFPADAQRRFDVLTLVGGKWSTYRACGAQITDAVLARLSRSRRADTTTLAIGGGRGWPKDERERQAAVEALAIRYGLSSEYAQHLWDRYGTGASAVASSVAAMGMTPLPDLPDYTAGEIAHIARHERVTRLADVLLRRTLIAFQGRCTARILFAIAEVVGTELGWDAKRRAREVDETALQLARWHGARIHPLSRQSALG